MDLYSFPPIAAVIDAAYGLANALVELLTPLAGVHSAALSVVLITVAVRTALIPAARAQVRAEATRRDLAPDLAELNRRYRSHPDVLQRKTAQLFRDRGASPFAGVLPALVQAPAVSTVYALFILGTISGHPNELLGATLFTVPLGSSLVHLVGTGLPWPGIAVFGCLLVVIGGVSLLARRAALSQQFAVTPGPTGPLPHVLSWLPMITVVIATLVPAAAALYLAVSTTWTLVERRILRRKLR
jgi:YidC/Oxa1 family membrane protein insertase